MKNNTNRPQKNIILNALDKIIGIIVVIILVILFCSKTGFISIFTPITTKGTVTNYYWQRTINIEKFDTVYRTENDFPNNDENAELISVEIVNDNELTRYKSKSEKRKKQHKEYYYKTKDWVLDTKIVTSESNRSPYWGEVHLSDNQRVGEKEEIFVIVIKTEDGAYTDLKVEISQNQWENINIEDTVELIYRKGNLFASENFIEKIVVNNEVIYQKKLCIKIKANNFW